MASAGAMHGKPRSLSECAGAAEGGIAGLWWFFAAQFLGGPSPFRKQQVDWRQSTRPGKWKCAHL